MEGREVVVDTTLGETVVEEVRVVVLEGIETEVVDAEVAAHPVIVLHLSGRFRELLPTWIV